MQIDPITAALGSTAASTTSVNGVNNFESYLNNAGNNSLASIFHNLKFFFLIKMRIPGCVLKLQFMLV